MRQIRAQVTVQPYEFPKVVREVLLQVDECGGAVRSFYRYLSWDEFEGLHQLNRETSARLRNRLAAGEAAVLEGVKSVAIEVRDDVGELP